MFAHLPLGARIPDTPHAVSCSLPTMRDVCGYEEGDAEILRHVTSGYPRFVVHAFARQLGTLVARDLALASTDRLWLTSSSAMAERCVADLRAHGGAEAAARVVACHGVHGVAHTDIPSASERAKRFLQHVGGYLSSREAEDHLVRLGARDQATPEPVADGDGRALVASQLAPRLAPAGVADLFVTNCGMSAMWAAFSAVSAVQAPRGRTAWLQIGWLYLDTIAILQKFTAAPVDYLYAQDVFDLSAIARIMATHGARLAGVVVEAPTNPLVQTADLAAIATLCRRHGARLVVDPSIASVFAVDVLPLADVVVSSLTKYTASDGDLTAGLVAINPGGPDAGALRANVASRVEPIYARDAARLAREMSQTGEVLARIHASTPVVAGFLASHQAVTGVHWAYHPASRRHIDALARQAGAGGGMITFSLKRTGALTAVYDRLRLPKGPSFGMKTTLLCPFMYLAHYDLVTSETGRARLRADGLDPDLLRLCVGTEPVDTVLDALAEGLAEA